jgi:hypothetical protein
MRCGIWYNRDQLQFQFEWRGTTLRNIFILVCRQCLDVPQEQLRAIQLPADPAPVYFPSVESFVEDETNYRSLEGGHTDPVTGIPVPSKNLRVTQQCENRVTQVIGAPQGLDQNAVMPFNGGTQQVLGRLLPLLSVNSNGTTIVTVTCNAVHGLQSGDQIAVQGLSDRGACGFFTVYVNTATVFYYMTTRPVEAAGLLTLTTRIITARVGLPYGTETIPQVT